MKDILLITPPFTQLNTPYPATAYLKGFLNTKDISATQMDLGIEVIIELFSKNAFTMLFDSAYENDTIQSENAQRIYTLKDDYLKVLEPIIEFLQGKNVTLARQICTDNFLPRASRFDNLEDLNWAFGNMGMQDKAKHLATLFLEDLSDFIIECIDDNFGFSRYAERLGMSANSFDELYDSLQQDITFIDDITLQILEGKLEEVQPKIVCLSVPFPGNLYSAFRCAQFIKSNYPNITVEMGGGFPNTELRSLKDVRVFEFFDFITLDDGELPVELLHDLVVNTKDKNTFKFKRTLLLENNAVVYKNDSPLPDYKQSAVGTPDYSDLLLDEYISVIEIANPMHSLWSDGRWNKLTMAHGCYWGKCTFCDISLDYIKIYEPIAAKTLVDRMEELIAQTGDTGFHFVDEAAPPSLMKALALEILKRDLTLTWWANIRFEKNFTQDLCILLKASGCIAVSGGLEVASDRLLKLIDKGVTVEQVAQVTRNLTESNIMVHSYLMYGYPTQTEQETIDSLEMVRQLFEVGVLQSGFWHQFALTAHSPIGLNPAEFGVTPHYNDITFANNDVAFSDVTGIDHSKFSNGLKTSLFNYMHGIGFDLPLQDWFDFNVPDTTVDSDCIFNALQTEPSFSVKPTAKIVWLGKTPFVEEVSKTKKGTTYTSLKMTFYDKTNAFQISTPLDEGEWLLDMLEQLKPSSATQTSFNMLKKDFESHFENFELFWFSKPINTLKAHGLLVL
ncbi:Fe-S oxireductase [Formosa agariphila KMM 3901]|uniref:Fe-S oxireductase n=1 Tax=Formosa agariphila (strain DSM 15362 / KCTC 12365 / LMG 23005 / KMM 3901 / M-2Alg 35-1) TaxID=1347342 RepID=T2KKG3_FORAG|nr:radical SAM protein [Formosa agariphila]CDF78906.1 Fe-S oxireductase [Formosa agariphila KMM 3901]